MILYKDKFIVDRVLLEVYMELFNKSELMGICSYL